MALSSLTKYTPGRKHHGGGDSWAEAHPRAAAVLSTTPYLLFLLMPLVGVILADMPTGKRLTIIAALVALGAAFLGTSAACPSAPPFTRIHWPIALGLVVQVALVIWLNTLFTVGSPYLLTFPAASVGILLPAPIVWPVTFALMTIAMIQSLLGGWVFNYLAVAVIGMSVMLTYSDHKAILKRREKDLELVASAQLSIERERLRISADLHDILGQTLTAIATRTEFIDKVLSRSGFISEGGPDDLLALTQTQAHEAHVLARQALADVRAVVVGTKQVTMASELDAAAQLLEVAGVNAHIEADPHAWEANPSGPVARFGPYVLREGVANIVHHAKATNCWVIVTAHSVMVCDDGVGAQPESQPTTQPRQGEEVRQGSGIEGLRMRVGAGAQLYAGAPTQFVGDLPKGTRWVLAMTDVQEDTRD
ncbi:MAG: histidine kinase [Actinomycetaceae bacterium]|nr:histidine kinase [Actinomycetaceae bacterium]